MDAAWCGCHDYYRRSLVHVGSRKAQQQLSFLLQDDISLLRRDTSFYASPESNLIQHNKRFRASQTGGLFVTDVLVGRGFGWPRNRVFVMPDGKLVRGVKGGVKLDH
jgi:hypothetical protein